MSFERNSTERPVIAISAGDPAGIGGEVLVKALAGGELARICRPMVVGARWAVEAGAAAAGMPLDDAIEFVDVGIPQPADFRFGAVSAVCGTVAVRAVERAASITADGK